MRVSNEMIPGGSSSSWAVRCHVRTGLPRATSSLRHFQRAAGAGQPLHLPSQRAAYIRANWFVAYYFLPVKTPKLDPRFNPIRIGTFGTHPPK